MASRPCSGCRLVLWLIPHNRLTEKDSPQHLDRPSGDLSVLSLRVVTGLNVASES